MITCKILKNKPQKLKVAVEETQNTARREVNAHISGSLGDECGLLRRCWAPEPEPDPWLTCASSPSHPCSAPESWAAGIPLPRNPHSASAWAGQEDTPSPAGTLPLGCGLWRLQPAPPGKPPGGPEGRRRCYLLWLGCCPTVAACSGH